MKKPISKKEIKAFLDHKWTERREKNKKRSEKTSELTKKWKEREKILKYLLELQKLNPAARLAEVEAAKTQSRRSTYITSPESPDSKP